MNWKGSDGDAYTMRNNPDVCARARFFKRIIPKKVKSVHEFGCNKGHNLEAIVMNRPILVSGNEPNELARNIARSKGLFVAEYNSNPDADMILCAGVIMHINPLDLYRYFNKFANHKYILFIEHKEDSIRTINSRWYKNAMWVMNTGEEFCKRHNYKIVKQGWVNGKKPKSLDYTAPLKPGQGFHDCDYFWLVKRK